MESQQSDKYQSQHHHHHSHHSHHSQHVTATPGFFTRLKLTFILSRWKKKTEVSGRDDLYLKRRYDYTRVYVDLYWNVHRRSDDACLATYDTRVNWADVKSELQRVEAEIVPTLVKK